MLKRRTTYGGPVTFITYDYDATGRLTSTVDNATGSFGTLGFSYDLNGNRQSETRNAGTVPYVYSPPGSNWLYQRGSDSRGKTANGNTASISGVASFAQNWGQTTVSINHRTTPPTLAAHWVRPDGTRRSIGWRVGGKQTRRLSGNRGCPLLSTL